MAYVRPRHLVSMQHFNNVSEVRISGNAKQMNNVDDPTFLTDLSNVASVQYGYGLSQFDYTHSRFVVTAGKANISVTTSVGGAIATSFQWRPDPATGNADISKVNWDTSGSEVNVGLGADGTPVLLIASTNPLTPTVYTYLFTPPAGAPAQTYIFSTVGIQGAINY